jgi:hypothetical protein
MDDQNIENLARKCRTILDFFENHSSEGNTSIESFKAVVAQKESDRNKRALKILLNDLVEWANGLNKSDFNKLNEVYYQINAENVNDNNDKLITRILKRGKINTEEEFRYLSLFVERSSEKNVVEKVNLIFD